jgi:hypothetical protein
LHAYNSLISTSIAECEDRSLVYSNSLHIINAPAHDWPTLLTVLEKVCKLNKVTCPDNPGKVMVTFYMDLYKGVLKLDYMDEK